MLLERLGYFLALADELHFGRAATRLRISQPALSQQIRHLERDLGANLCIRGPRGVKLTTAGDLLREGARSLLADYERLTDQVRAAGQGRTGTLRIAYTRSAAELSTHDLVAAFQDQYPDITVRTTTGWTALNIRELRDHTVDAAFVRTPLTADGIAVQPLATGEMVAILPRDHALTGQRRVRADQLLDERFIFWPREQAEEFYDDILGQLWAERRPMAIIEEPDAEHIIASVAAGRGFSVLDRRRAGRLRRRGSVIRPFAPPTPTSGLALAWLTGATTPSLQRFIDYCRHADH